MRRFLSISVIAAMISSMLTPMMAAACTGTEKPMACHSHGAAAVDHCDRPKHQHHHGVATPPSNAAISAADDAAKCPMDCCMTGHTRNGAVVSDESLLPPLAVTDRETPFAPIAFTIAGFSSHTDRGPPLA